MKAIARSASLILLIACFILPVRSIAGGDGPSAEKKKSYTKTYPLNSSDRVDLDGRFGEMKITTWPRNEIKVDVEIITKVEIKSGSNAEKEEQMAQDMLDRIQILDGKENGKVYFRTKIGDENEKWKGSFKNVNTSMKINYTVYLPAGQPLNAHNEFGAMSIPDYSGKLTLESKFGSLTTGKLSNPDKVWVEFGKTSIGEMNGGSLTVKFSRAEVGNLNGSVKASFEFCSGVMLNLTNNLKDLNIKNSYTQLFLNASENLSAQYDVYTNFSEFRNKTNFGIKEEGEDDDRHGPKFDHQYNGKSGSGNIAIKIKSEFGEVTMGHNLSFDVNAEESKDKKKVRSI